MGGSARLVGLCLVLSAGCDELGNPVGHGGPTPSLVWESEVVNLTTRTETVPAERAAELAARVPADLLFHAERPSPSGYATLVTVTPQWKRQPRAPLVPLVTELRLRDGSVVQTAWSAPVSVPSWHAFLAPASTPVAAATALAQ
jgi:hypothetical protein